MLKLKIRPNKQRSLTVVELLAMLCILAILLGIFAVYAQVTLKVARQTSLRNELNNIRMSIQHYRVINSKFPKDLFSLMNQEFTYKDNQGTVIRVKYLKPFRVDKQGFLLDTFMNRYYYNSNNGDVRSQTLGYESW